MEQPNDLATIIMQTLPRMSGLRAAMETTNVTAVQVWKEKEGQGIELIMMRHNQDDEGITQNPDWRSTREHLATIYQGEDTLIFTSEESPVSS